MHGACAKLLKHIKVSKNAPTIHDIMQYIVIIIIVVIENRELVIK